MKVTSEFENVHEERRYWGIDVPVEGTVDRELEVTNEGVVELELELDTVLDLASAGYAGALVAFREDLVGAEFTAVR